MKLVCNSYTYTDKVASLVQEAAYLQANLSNQEGDAASIPVSHIDGEHFEIRESKSNNLTPVSMSVKPTFLNMSSRRVRHAGCHNGWQ